MSSGLFFIKLVTLEQQDLFSCIKLLSIFVQSKKNNTYIMVKILMLIPVFIIVVILQFSAIRFKKTKEEKYTVDGKNIKASNIISICSLFTFIICMFAIVLGSDLFYILGVCLPAIIMALFLTYLYRPKKAKNVPLIVIMVSIISIFVLECKWSSPSEIA